MTTATVNVAVLELCPKCKQPLKDGDILTGQTWNGEGGEHVACPVAPAVELFSDVLAVAMASR